MRIEPLRRPSLAFVLLALVTLACMMTEMPRVHRIRDAASPDVLLFNHHDHLGDRIDVLTTNAASRALFQAGGVTPRNLQKWRTRPETRFWLEELLPGRAVLLYEPRLGQQGTPGWVAVSWIGGRSGRMRALLETVGIKNYVPLHRYRSKRLYAVRPGKNANPTTLALHEGMLVACVHEDPTALHDVLDRLDGLRPRFSDVYPELLAPLDASTLPDRGAAFLDWGDQVLPLYGEIEELSARRLRLSVGVPTHFVDHWKEVDLDLRRFSAKLTGPHVLLQGALPGEVVPDLPASTLSVMAWPHFGRVSFVSAPALVCVQAAAGPQEALDQAAALLSRIDPGLRWQVLPHPGGLPIWSQIPSGPSWTRLLSEAQAPALAWLDGYLVLCSSRQVLLGLLERYQKPESTYELRQVSAWSETPGLLAYANLPKAGGQLEPLVRLWLLHANSTETSKKRADNRTQRFTGLLEDLKRLPLVELRFQRDERDGLARLMLSADSEP